VTVLLPTKLKCFNCWELFWDFDKTQCYCNTHRKVVIQMADEEVKEETSEEEKPAEESSE
jgi:hypothetical protein